MNRFGFIKLVLVFVLAVNLTASSSIKFNSFDDDKVLIKELQKGGYSFYFRHSKTLRTKRLKEIDLNDCSTQRNLSVEGKILAKEVAKYLKTLNIKIDKVLSSPYCRAKDTASYMFSRVNIDDSLSYSMYDNEKIKLSKKEGLKSILLRKPKVGFNSIAISHTSNLQDLAKIWLKHELGLAIFKAQNDGTLKHIATINPDQWENINK